MFLIVYRNLVAHLLFKAIKGGWSQLSKHSKGRSYDPGNWADPLSEISAHSYFPIKNSVAFIWANGLAR